MENKALEAAILYLKRKMSFCYPEGKKDSGGRWYPSDEESASCCNQIYSPSRAYPWTLWKHCFSLKHISNRFGVPEQDVRNCLKKKNIPLLIGIDSNIDKFIENKLKGVNRVPNQTLA